MSEQKKAEAKIDRVLKKLAGAQVDTLAGNGKGADSDEFKAIAEAVMAWYALLLGSNIVDRRTAAAKEVLASSMLVLGTLVKYAYALGVRRGQRQRSARRKRRGVRDQGGI